MAMWQKPEFSLTTPPVAVWSWDREKMNHKPLRAGGKRRSVRLKERSRVESKPDAQSPVPNVTSHGKFHLLTPPPFSLSFGSEPSSSEVVQFLEHFDDYALVSSTPLDSKKIPPSKNYPLKQSLFDLSNIDGSKNQSASFLTTPTKPSKNNLQLSSWGIPQHVLDQYAIRGITTMFPWQAECLTIPGVLEGGNLVFSAPTSAGKTLVAELLALKCALELKRKVIIVLPFVSIAHEKSNYLKQVFEPSGVKVGGFIGNQAPAGGFASVDIAICTIEKANSLVNRLLENGTAHLLGLVVVDELHMVGDPYRGYLLELLLTKLLYVSKKQARKSNEEVAHSHSSIQLVGMSATLPNLDMLASWLGAQLFHTDFRPVPLQEMVKVGPTLFDIGFKALRTYDPSESLPGDEDDILLICRETVSKGHSVLIFCPTKAWCENLCLTLGQAKVVEVNKELSKALTGVCEQLHRTQVGIDPALERSVPNGVGFHHAGLTMEEREIVEGAYRQSHLKVLVATSTLSSGVNLPARLVVIRTPFFQRSLLDVLVYKQMVGRAGRKGVDESGESILICKPSERSKVVGMLKAAPKPVTSCLSSPSMSMKDVSANLSAMKRALLEVITSSTANTVSELQSYTSCTLLYAEITKDQSAKNVKLEDVSRSALELLKQNEFISSHSNQPHSEEIQKELSYYATQFGAATVASSLSPDEALVVLGDLLKARKNFVLENELHIIYLVTPVYVQNQWPTIDWYKYFCLWERLPPPMKHVAEILGVRESFLAQAVQGRLPERTPAQKETLRIHRRFYTALALHDLVHEAPIIYVTRRYGATKGLLQTLQSAAGTFAGMVTVFCNKLGWKNLELLLSQFQSRLLFGIERELCDLVKISLLNGFRARALYNAGFHSLPALATANPLLIENCLRSAVPFKSQKNSGAAGEGTCTTWCAKLRQGLSEEKAAKQIVEEAQKIISSELNLPASAWKRQITVNSELKRQPLKFSGMKFQKSKKIRKSPNLGEIADELSTKKQKIVQPLDNLGTATPSHVITTAREPMRPSLPPLITNNVVEPVKQPQANTSSQPKSVIATPMDTSALHFIEDSLISFSPILSLDPSQSSSIKEQYKREKLTPRESPEPLLIVPDSFMDNSFSFSFDTYEKIDAACRAEGSTSLVRSPVELVRPHRGVEITKSTPPKTILPLSTVDVAVETIAESPVEILANDVKLLQGEVSVIAESPAACGSDHQTDRAKASLFKTPTRKTFGPINVTSSPLCLRELSSLCSSQLTQSGVTIIDITSNKTLFDTFVSECLEQSSLSFSVAVMRTDQSNGIGCTIIEMPVQKGIILPGGNEQVVGIAFCWGELDVYYMSLCKSVECVSLDSRNEAITRIFTKSNQEQRLIAYDMKRHVKYLALTCGILPARVALDPKVGDWLLNPDQKEKTIHRMVLQYLPDQPSMSEDDDEDQVPLSNLATHASDPQIKASAESVLAFLLTSKVEALLKTEGLHKPFIEVEMPSLLVLAKLELNGIGFSPEECTIVKNAMQKRISELEKEAYTLAHHTFSLTSPEDVAQVLFIELKLPHGGESGKKTLGANTRRKRATNMSTAKSILEKITSLHPLPGIVLEWRRISSTVSNMVFPLFKEAVSHKDIKSIRIHPKVQVHTATGRVTMSNPSLQMVPKEFEIGTKLSFTSLQAPSLFSDSQYLEVCQRSTDECEDKLPSSVSMRNVFVPFKGGVFLAADYSQLELRILAHMSKDKKLIKFLNHDGDVFRLIASEWLGILPDEVGDKQRQETKQICYGMLYGIGAKALGEQLGLDENDAAQFIESFKMKYPAMKRFIKETVQNCKENGYICTLLGRKRYLPGIHSTNVHARAQAERQAVNSSIQGSAADLVKTAMIKIDRVLEDIFPSTVLTSAARTVSSGAYFVLQLHDELLYEVAEKDLPQVARIVKEGMENAMELTVKFPVKVKSGLSWGQLDVYNVQ